MTTYFGLYRGVVKSTSDPKSLRRVQVTVPQVTGTAALWAMPCETSVSDPQPTVGAGVWVSFEQGDPTKPVLAGSFVGTVAEPRLVTPEQYGAKGNGTTDDQVALAAALASLKPGDTLLIPAGKTYLHSSYLRVATNGVRVVGGGRLLATNQAYASLVIDTVDGVLVEGITLELRPDVRTLNTTINNSTTTIVVTDGTNLPASNFDIIVDPGTESAERVHVVTRSGNTLTVTRGISNYAPVAHTAGATIHYATRQSGSEAHLLYSTYSTGLTVRGVTAKNGAASGFLLENSSNYTFEECKVFGGWADSFHNTHGSTGGRFLHCEALAGGDDSFAVVGYESVDHPLPPSNIVFDSCRSTLSHARGFAVVGGQKVTITDPSVDRSAAAAYYVACEGSFTTYGVSGVVIQRGSSTGSNVAYATLDHGSIIIYNGRGGSYVIDDVVIKDMDLRDTPGGSREISVIGYSTPIITNLRFERVDVVDSGAGSTIGGNVSLATTYQDIRNITGYAPPSGVSGEWTLVGKNSGTTTASLTTSCTAVGATQYKVVIQTQNTSVADIPAIQFNGDTGANYTYRHMTVGATGTTLTDVQAGNATSAQLSGVSRVGERVIEINIQRDTLNSTGTVTAAASNRSKTTVTGTWDMAGQINWYPGNYNEITSVTVLTVGGATFNKIRVWVYAILP